MIVDMPSATKNKAELTPAEICAICKITAMESATRGAIVAQWAVALVVTTAACIAMVDATVALVAAVFLMIIFSFATSVVWWLYRGVMIKNLKKYSMDTM